MSKRGRKEELFICIINISLVVFICVALFSFASFSALNFVCQMRHSFCNIKRLLMSFYFPHLLLLLHHHRHLVLRLLVLINQFSSVQFGSVAVLGDVGLTQSEPGTWDGLKSFSPLESFSDRFSPRKWQRGRDGKLIVVAWPVRGHPGAELGAEEYSQCMRSWTGKLCVSPRSLAAEHEY